MSERVCAAIIRKRGTFRSHNKRVPPRRITGAERVRLDLLSGRDSPSTMHRPTNVQLIGQEVAIAWDDGAESYFNPEQLRAASPSAETQGERDVFGHQYGGGGSRKFPGVQVLGWEQIGNYALRFDFSDGHRTGLYSFDYLRKLAGQ
jgi:DUF971 family protein